MTPDLMEQRLREVLSSAAEAEAGDYIDIHPDLTLATGHRVLRRRRLAMVGGAVAVVLAVGLVGAAIAGVDQDRSGTSLPAGATGGLGEGSVSVDLDVDAPIDSLEPAGPSSPASVRVDVGESALTWRATVTSRDRSVTSGPVAALPANPLFATYDQVDGVAGLVVGVMPAAARDIAALWSPDPVQSSFASAPVPGTDRQVFSIRHSGGPDTVFAGFDWTDGEQVFTSGGTPVHSGQFGDDVAFVDETQDLFGLLGPATSATQRLSDTPSGQLASLATRRVPDGSDTMESTVLVLLPAGAQGVDVRPSSGSTVRSVDSVAGGSVGRTLVVVRLAEPKTSVGTGIQQVLWTNVDGTAGSGAIS